MIQFDLLGEIRLQGPDGGQLDQLLRQPKRLALLAYLVVPVPGTWHRRDTLLAMFWPELDAAHARTSLRNSLYVLRQALGDAVIQSRGNEEISVDAALLQTDLGALAEAIRSGRVETGLAIYRGDLLAGLFPPDSEGFERWVEAERGRIRMEMARAAAEWSATLEQDGRLTEAASVARRVLEIHPDDETSVRRLMTLLGAMGNRAGALSVFEEYRGRLAKEFEAEPARETQAMANQLRGSVGPIPVSPAPDSLGAKPSFPPVATPIAAPVGGNQPRHQLRNRVVAGVVLALSLSVAWATWRKPVPPSLGQSRPLTSEEGLQIEPAISPDGRLVAYAKGTPQRMRVFVQNVSGGPAWALSGDSSSVEIMPRWSPDSDRLLYLARNGAWMAPTTGGTPRLVVPGGENEAVVRSASWSPRGDSIAVVRNDSLTVRPADGSGFRFVGQGNQLHSCVWSPDARWIACVSGNWVAFMPGTLFGNRAPSTIMIFPAAGGEGRALTDGDQEYQSPAWSADGRHLWVLSNRDGPSGEAYAIPINRHGEVGGEVARVGLRAESVSLSADRVAYSVYTRTANIWAVPIPATGSTTLAQAERITSGNQIIEVLRTSFDGKWLVYDSNLRGNSDIYRLPTAGGPVERLTDDPREEFAGELSPDGRELAYHLWVGGERRIFVKELKTGLVAEPIAVAGDQGVPRWAPSGLMLAGWHHAVEPGSIFVTHRDPDGKWQSPAWSLPDAQLPVWSPDGRTIAYVTPAGTIELIGMDSTRHRVVYQPRAGSGDPIATNVAWDAGRAELWFIGHLPSGQGGIWAIPLTGGTARQVVDFQDAAGRTNGPTFASDGRRFYFTLDERISNIRWAVLTTR